MSAPTETLELMEALAGVQVILGDIHSAMENSGRFINITNLLIPISGQGAFEDSKRTSLSFFVEGDLKRWIDANKKATGFSLSISHFEGKWSLEYEHGWGGQDVGWDPVVSFNSVYESPRDLIPDLTAAALKLQSMALEFLSSHDVPSGRN